MKEEREVKVTIKENGHIFHDGNLIAILSQWNSYWDLKPDKKRKKK